MTDKKRLESLKRNREWTEATGGKFYTVDSDDYKWLIKQAERAEYYEAQNEQKIHAFEEIIDLLNEDYFENWEQAIEVAHKYKNDFVRAEKISSDLRIRATKESLKEQNKRYREALEAIAYFDDKEEGEAATRIDARYIARKALEDEE